jgi:excisionase family DNA binding protein
MMTQRTTMGRLHSAKSAAELLGVRPSTIRWWWTIGKLHRVKIGRLTRVRESELLALIHEQKGAAQSLGTWRAGKSAPNWSFEERKGVNHD